MLRSWFTSSSVARLIIAAGIVLLACYAVFLRRHLSFAVGGPDTGGYFNEAKMFASGRITRPVTLARELRLDESWLRYFMPLGFAPSPHMTMHALYPAGLPIHAAIAAKIGGWKHAPYYIAPLAAIGCAILMFMIGLRLGIPHFLSLCAASTLVLLPPFLWHAVQPASDVLCTFWTLVAIFCALRSIDRPWMAFVAGAAFGISVWVRPTNVLLVFALVLAMQLRLRLLVSAGIAATPFAVSLMWLSARLYGSPFRTGYGDVALTWQGVKDTAPQYVNWLMRMLTPLAFPLGLLVAFDRRIVRWTRWMLVAWFVPYLIFYCFYGFWDGWICMRFILPAIPPLIFGALLLMKHWRVWVAVPLALCIAAAPVWSTYQLDIVRWLKQIELGYPQYVTWAEKKIPKRSLVITGVLSGAFLYYADRGIARYDQMDDNRFQLLRAYAANAGMPIYVICPDSELDATSLNARFRGNWTFVDRLFDVNIFRLD